MATGAKRPSHCPVGAANFSLWPHLASCPRFVFVDSHGLKMI